MSDKTITISVSGMNNKDIMQLKDTIFVKWSELVKVKKDHAPCNGECYDKIIDLLRCQCCTKSLSIGCGNGNCKDCKVSCIRYF